jgi:hypothetical protein
MSVLTKICIDIFEPTTGKKEGKRFGETKVKIGEKMGVEGGWGLGMEL